MGTRPGATKRQDNRGPSCEERGLNVCPPYRHMTRDGPEGKREEKNFVFSFFFFPHPGVLAIGV